MRIFRFAQRINNLHQKKLILNSQVFFCHTSVLQDQLKYQNILNSAKFQCQGCGSLVHCENKDTPGFIEKKRLIEKLKNHEQNQIELNKNSNPDFDFLHSFEISLKEQNLICQRCFDLKTYQKTQKIQHTYEQVVKLLFNKIKPNNYVLYLLGRFQNKDIFNLNATIDQKIIQKLQQKNCDLIFIVNKYDTLPKNIIEPVLRRTVKESIASATGMTMNRVFFVSAKTGQGLDQVSEHLEQCFELHKHLQKKIYVVGTTNTGKSTFLNKMIEMQNRKYKQNINTNLTTSNQINTTLDFIKVKHIHLYFPLYDTPGLPNQLQQYISEYDKIAKDLLIVKQCPAFSKYFIKDIKIQEKDCVYVGDFCRIDNNSQFSLFSQLYININIPVSVINKESANKFYLNRKSFLQQQIFVFEKHDIQIQQNEELEIENLGILRFAFRDQTKKGEIQLTIYVPKFVQFRSRKATFDLQDINPRNLLKKRQNI